MGDEINTSQFSDNDFQAYYDQLKNETLQLEQLFLASLTNQANEKEDSTSSKLSSIDNYCGLEQEAWILNHQNFPVAENQFLLDTLNHSLLSPELARFNLEMNVTPQVISPFGLTKMHKELEEIWRLCDTTLESKNLHLEMIGILPTISNDVLTVENMSAMKRYRALNDQVLKFRDGEPLKLDIVGVEHLKSQHEDVMLESAATSLQLHRQVSAEKSARYYNAAILVSAITVAISANSPFLFGKTLWEETRIPLFEQAVDVGGYGSADHGPLKRVSFGSSYVKDSIFECFKENLDHYPVLLPVKLDTDKKFSYLKMHNGTIWRWNRPIIGADEDGTTHLRIEHRVMSAGPTMIDEMANAAFFYGLQEYFATHDVPAEKLIEFSTAKDNFYRAAQHGLKAQIIWPNRNNDSFTGSTDKFSIQSLITNELLNCAEKGLIALKVDNTDIRRYLDVIAGRVKNLQTGAFWQKKYLEKISEKNKGRDIENMQKLLIAYREQRLTGTPVHTWPI